MPKKKEEKRLTPEEEINLIREKLGYVVFKRDEETYPHFDTGNPDLNEIFGDRELGIRWGSIIEIAGPESSGKTLVATRLAAIAQADDPKHTYVGKEDLEESNDDRLNERMGIDLKRFYLFGTQMAAKLKDYKAAMASYNKEKDRKKKKEILKAVKKYELSAEQSFTEVEEWWKLRKKIDPKAKIVMIIDSVTGILVEEEETAGLDKQNMRTNVAQASFMSKLMKRWVKKCARYTVIALFINQERTAPGIMFGNPIYTSGGKALKYYSSVRARTRRIKNGKVKRDGKVVGIRSLITNVKNKVGGNEYEELAFKAYTRGSKGGKWSWMSRNEAEREAKQGKQQEG